MGTILLAFTASTLAEFSLKFGPAEMFSLVLMGMFMIIYVGGKDVTKSLMSMAIGLDLGTVGTDIVEGKDRFTYGISELLDGIDFVILVMGTFGIAEVLESAEEFMKIVPMKVKFRDLFPKIADIWYCRWAILRGTCVGFFIYCIYFPGRLQSRRIKAPGAVPFSGDPVERGDLRRRTAPPPESKRS